MPSSFDCFTVEAGQTNDNGLYLRKVMSQYGFKPLATEWWHFEDLDEYQPFDDQAPQSLKAINNDGAVTITLSAIGDVTLGQDERFPYPESFNQYYSSKGLNYFFSGIRGILSEDDLTIANLEGPLTEALDRQLKNSVNLGTSQLTKGQI